jgi:hypothetical protein
MNESAQPVWGEPEVIIPVILGDAAVSFSRISATLSVIFTGLTVDLQDASDRRAACAAVHLWLPFSISPDGPITLRGQLRGSLLSSGMVTTQVYLLAGPATQVLNLSGEQGDWSLDLALEGCDWTRATCTLHVVVTRGSAKETAVLSVDTLDLVADVEAPA